MMSTSWTLVQKPQPLVTAISEPFWTAAASHVLKIQKCPNCARLQYPALLLCPQCSTELSWIEASGLASLYTFTVIRLVFHPAFEQLVPYNVAVVQLDEGPFMVTNVVEIENEELEIGMSLQVVFDDVAEGVGVPMFAPRTAL